MTAVFLDRDGIINQKAAEGEYIATWEAMRFLPDVFSSIGALYRAGFRVMVVTNQRGVALGKVRLEDLERIHGRLRAAFAQQGVLLTDIYFCPHDLSERCSCRKPKPGMLLRAAQEHALDLSACWMIGDAASDIAAGKNAGCRTAWILPAGSPRREDLQADVRAHTLAAAVRRILRLSRMPAQALHA
jgi:histidinol-phosphate phosphatase family protein